MPSSSQVTILTASDVDELLARLDLGRAVRSQAAVFDALSASAATTAAALPAIQNPHRSTIETEAATSLFMPARVAGLATTTCKIVSVPKAGQTGAELGLPATTVVLDDYGKLRGVVNARRLTAMRNACGSALFLQRYPPRNPLTSCVIFGSGEQAYAHASVLLRLHNSIRRCIFVVRRATDRARELHRRIQEEHASVDVQLQASEAQLQRLDHHNRQDGEERQSDPRSSSSGASPGLRDTLQQADIVVTATPSQHALFPSSWIAPGTRLILIGSYKPHMREVEDELIKRASLVVVDSKAACLQEAGEIISGGLTGDDLVELGDQSSPARAGEGGSEGEDIVIFKSVGLGVQDVAIAKLVVDEAEAMGLGTRIDTFD